MGFAKRLVVFLLIIVLLALLAIYYPVLNQRLSGNEETIRLLGINNPKGMNI